MVRLILLTFLSFTILMTLSCDESQEQEFSKKQKIALCQKKYKDKIEYEVALFADSTFYLSSNSNDNEDSQGTFSVHSTRYHFQTKSGRNHLCEFYYFDSIKYKLWSPKNCDEDYMDVTFLK